MDAVVQSIKSSTFEGVFNPRTAREKDYGYLKVENYQARSMKDFLEHTVLVSVLPNNQTLIVKDGMIEKRFSEKEKYQWTDENIPMDEMFLHPEPTAPGIGTFFHTTWGHVVSEHSLGSWNKEGSALVFPASSVEGRIHKFTPLDTMVVGRIPQEGCTLVLVKGYSGRQVSMQSFQSTKDNIREAVDEFCLARYPGHWRYVPSIKSAGQTVSMNILEEGYKEKYVFIDKAVLTGNVLALITSIVMTMKYFPWKLDAIVSIFIEKWREDLTHAVVVNLVKKLQENYQPVLNILLTYPQTLSYETFWQSNGVVVKGLTDLEIWSIMGGFNVSKVFDFNNSERTIIPYVRDYLQNAFIEKAPLTPYLATSKDSAVMRIGDVSTLSNFYMEFTPLVSQHPEIFNPAHDGAVTSTSKERNPLSVTLNVFPDNMGPIDTHQLFFTFNKDDIGPLAFKRYIEGFGREAGYNEVTSMLTVYDSEKQPRFIPLALYYFNLQRRLSDKIFPLQEQIKINFSKAFDYIKIWYCLFITGHEYDVPILQAMKNKNLSLLCDTILNFYVSHPLTKIHQMDNVKDQLINEINRIVKYWIFF